MRERHDHAYILVRCDFLRFFLSEYATGCGFEELYMVVLVLNDVHRALHVMVWIYVLQSERAKVLTFSE